MKNVFKILKSTSELWGVYAKIGFFTVTLAIINLAQPLIAGRAIDEISSEFVSIQTLAILALGLFVMDFTTTVLSNIGGHLGDKMAARLQQILSERYYSHILSLPQSYFDTELSGKIINRLNRSISELSSFMQMMSNNFLQFIFSTVFSLAVILYYSWQVAALLALLYPVYFWITTRSSGKWLEYKAKMNTHFDKAIGRFSEGINQMKVVKSFNQQHREHAFFSNHMQAVTDLTKPQSIHWHKNDFYRRVSLNIIFLAVFGYIFIQAGRGEFTAGVAVTLILFAIQIRIPIFTVSFLVDRTQRAVADSKDYFEALEQQPEIQGNSKKLNLKSTDVVFDKVNFGYNEKDTVLTDISFTLKKGTKTALVGESGEGKTTISNLLMGLYSPDSGDIKIGKQTITEIGIGSVRHTVGVVFQDASLFSGTIHENIAYAKPTATKEEVYDAAKAANAHGFISDFSSGYESEIGERGIRLSGGQKQRIAIARALLKDAPILILDEATSSLDSKSEYEVQKALEVLMKNRTTLIIAHRLSTIAHVDTIVTLKNGTVDEIGSPKQLAKTDGIYSQLLKLQSDTDGETEILKTYDITAS